MSDVTIQKMTTRYLNYNGVTKKTTASIRILIRCNVGSTTLHKIKPIKLYLFTAHAKLYNATKVMYSR